MNWNNHSRDIPKDSHALLSPSTYSWLNYDDDKLFEFYVSKLASIRGTMLHDLACRLIRMKVILPDTQETFNMYVNDCIRNKMSPEVQLYYSKFCYGTADAIDMKDGLLKVFDLKTGKAPASFQQLRVYAALFYLEYPIYCPGDCETVLRIYQNNEILEEVALTDEIVPIMSKIVKFSNVLERMEENYGDGISDALWGRTR